MNGRARANPISLGSERQERGVGHDNCVSFNHIKLQIPANQHRCHNVKAKVTVLRYLDGRLAILLVHGKLPFLTKQDISICC